MTEDRELPLLAHLAELRRRILTALSAVALAALVAYGFAGPVMGGAQEAIRPALEGRRLVFLTPAEAFFTEIKFSLFLGLFLALPVVLHQAWSFVRVALFPVEARFFRFLLVSSVLSFYAGAAFAWFVAIPYAIRFLLSGQLFTPMISVESWFSFLAGTSTIFGAMFQTPLVILALDRSGLLPARLIARARRLAVVGIFVLAGVFSPPDVVSQFLVAVPMLLLFEAGLLLARLFPRATAGGATVGSGTVEGGNGAAPPA